MNSFTIKTILHIQEKIEEITKESTKKALRYIEKMCYFSIKHLLAILLI